MALWTDIVNPADLTGFARVEQEQNDTSVFSQILPNVYQDDVKFTWHVDQILADVAEYGEFDTEAPIGRSGGREEKTVRLLPVMKKLRLSEYEQVIDPDRVQEKADEKAAAVVNFIINRLNQARAEALLDGTLDLNENGLVQTVDFGRDSGQTNVAPATLWGDAGADPIVDLQAWRDLVQDSSGATPDVIVVSSRVRNALGAALANAGYIASMTERVSGEAVNAVLTDNELPTVVVDNSRVAGQRLIPDDRLIMAVRGVSGGTVFGPTAEAKDPRYNLSGSAQNGLIAGVYKDDDPPVQWVLGKAVALPILANPNTSLSADVL